MAESHDSAKDTNGQGQSHQGALDHITVKGFRSIKSIEALKISPINVLIGANGSGKSNFVEVFSFLRVLREGRLRDYVVAAGGAEKILHFGSKVTPKLEIEIAFRDEIGYDITLTLTAQDGLSVSDESSWSQKDKHVSEEIFFPPAGREAAIRFSLRQPGIGALVQSRLDGWRVYHFHDTSATSRIKKTADINDNRFLRDTASNLAAYLYFLKQKHEPQYQLIRKTVQLVAPFFSDFHLEPLRLNPNTIQLEWVHKSSDAYFDASSLSDGTLRFICLCTLFLQPAEHLPSLILVDEPELGLHPAAIVRLASLIKAAAIHTQIIVSTQSPLLLDQFSPDDVLVADLEEGATTLRRLDSKDLEVWLEDYSLGELWEKNQFGGRPTRG
ncbi:MAG: AAA family ATPase [Isosphaeraceae bacterium]